MTIITKICAREILDSRGNPTVEVDVTLKSGYKGRAAAPSGASKGAYEAVELRDGDSRRYNGKGVQIPISRVSGEIAEAILGIKADDQANVDATLIALDGTKNKARLGANVLVAVSLAVSKAAAAAFRMPLYRYIGGDDSCVIPVPMMNVINGGAHADNAIDIQEFMIVPKGLNCFSEALRAGAEIFQTLKIMLQDAGHSTNVGDEGGFAPNLGSSREALEFIVKSIKSAGYEPGKDVFIALDVAGNELYENGRYYLKGEKNHFDSAGMTEYLRELVKEFPIISIEDGMAEDDWEGWKRLTCSIGADCQIVGDDLFVTNPDRLAMGIKRNVANSVLIKINQIGTLTETCETVRMAHHSSYTTIMSHRSGETEDTAIADLSVALGCCQAKMGSLCRSERLAKYNQLLRIEEELGDKVIYAGLL